MRHTNDVLIRELVPDPVISLRVARMTDLVILGPVRELQQESRTTYLDMNLCEKGLPAQPALYEENSKHYLARDSKGTPWPSQAGTSIKQDMACFANYPARQRATGTVPLERPA